MHVLRLATLLSATLALGACAEMGAGGSKPAPAPVTPGEVTSSNPAAAAAAGVTPVTAGDAAAAAAADAANPGTAAKGVLGTTIASLGDATQGGLWLKTPLVKAQGRGRITDAETGRSADVTLIPLGGAASGGSQISIQAMQALGLGLTDLPELRVTAA